MFDAPTTVPARHRPLDDEPQAAPVKGTPQGIPTQRSHIGDLANP
jgi:hypothetical protein